MQLKLFDEKVEKEFGGDLNRGRRKRARPLDPAQPVHLVLKAGNGFSLLENRRLVEEKLRTLGEKFGVRVYRVVVHADHVHVLLKVPDRRRYNAWVRAVSGVLARKIAGLTWRTIPYTRLASWGRDYRGLVEYLDANAAEVEFLDRVEREVAEFRAAFFKPCG